MGALKLPIVSMIRRQKACVHRNLSSQAAAVLQCSLSMRQKKHRHTALFWITWCEHVLTASVQEFDAFIEKHPEVLDTVKVPLEDIRAKARILVLLSIASRENELSFAAIKVRSRMRERGGHLCNTNQADNSVPCLAVFLLLNGHAAQQVKAQRFV